MLDKKSGICLLILAILAYFVSYPEDVEALIEPISTILNLTAAISPWFCGVVAVGIIAAAIVKTWGGRVGS